MDFLVYIFFFWLIDGCPGLSDSFVDDVISTLSSTPWLCIPLLIAVIGMGMSVFSRYRADTKDNGRG